MKFIDFLNESSDESNTTHKTVLTKDKAIELIKAHCDIDNYLYRGYKSGGDYLLFDGSKGNRVSPDSSNHHNIIMDHIFSTSYKEFPLRSKSTICTTQKWYAEQYGEVYVILPYKDIDVAVMGDADMFDKRVELGLANFSVNQWNMIYDEMGLPNDNFNNFVKKFQRYWDTSSSDIIDNFDEYFEMKNIDDYDINDIRKYAEDEFHDDYFTNGTYLLNCDDFHNEVNALLYTIFMYNQNTLKYTIEEAYDPYTLGMDVIKSTEIKSIKGDQEVWFSGKCIAIKKSEWEELKKDL